MNSRRYGRYGPAYGLNGGLRLMTTSLVLLMLLSLMLLTSCKLFPEKKSVVFERSGKDVIVNIEGDDQGKAVSLNQTIVLGGPGQDSRVIAPE
ncbi:MAG: hypothetical protein V1866_05310 [archaeon]